MVHLLKFLTKKGKVRVLGRNQYENLQREFWYKYGIEIPDYKEYKMKVAKERK